MLYLVKDNSDLCYTVNKLEYIEMYSNKVSTINLTFSLLINFEKHWNYCKNTYFRQ